MTPEHPPVARQDTRRFTIVNDDSAGLSAALLEDGRPLLGLMALGLVLSGIFALFLAATQTFLPHDIAFLGMQPNALCALHGCRIVHFMFHDRVSFGGTLIATGTLYLWLIAFPLPRGEAWAWLTLLISGTFGFLTFFAYLIYGYLDWWHAVASLGLLPLFCGGLWKTRSLVAGPLRVRESLLSPSLPLALRTRQGFGRACLLFVGAGMTLAGSVITVLGSTIVFVPQDHAFLGFTTAQLNALNPRLVPLIAHDRAGFGGGLACCGLTVMLIVWKAKPAKALWQALLLGGLMGFGCAIGIHYPMEYLSFSHLLPAYVGASIYLVGIICYRPPEGSYTSGAASQWKTSAASPLD
jgi:hypothetical protein